MKLIIFDLDQTLVDFLPVHEEVVHRLLKQEFKIEANLTEIDFSGRSLMDTMVELAHLKGVPQSKIDRTSRIFLELYERTFRELMPPHPQKHILPGARELLQRLTEEGHFMVLYTGDSPGIVKAVLSATRLEKYFKFAVYGTESPTRLDMAKLAVKKAEAMAGTAFNGKSVVVVGDSTRDIEVGKNLGALTIAVATGYHTAGQLRAWQPDYLFINLRDTGKISGVIDSSDVEIPAIT